MLSRDVSKLGRAGDLVKVAPGYARNYLIPQGLGVRATTGILKQVERTKAREQVRLQAEREEAESRKTALETINRFVIRKKVGEGDAIFGTVTDRDVATVIQEASGLEIDPREVTVPEISKTGVYEVHVKFHAEVTATIRVQVTPGS
ncbi:50S ribosomal protein L9 [Leptolyngbya sp. FACHB-261]|nr:50S ribosomal protein L9 [Leptolyngbya sp. FACHB-261]